MCQNDFRPKETEAYISELSMFFKGKHELKTLNVLFLESAFKDLSCRSFLKSSD